MADSRLRWLAVALLFVLVGCGEAPNDGHGHAHGPETSDHGHDHGDEGGREALVYTDYTEVTELFVEFPALVVGESSRFAAHVTRLADAAPLTSGVLDVILERGGRTVARFRVDAPARTGIFTPEVVPRDAGRFQLAIVVADGSLSARHELGEVRVFTNESEVAVNQPEGEGDIGYLKEQQWTNPFSTTVVGTQPLRESAPAFAIVQAPGDAQAELRAPSAGYVVVDGNARAGALIEAAQRLGQLVPRLEGSTDLAGLELARREAEARERIAARELERLEPLFEAGAVAERRVVAAREELALAGAELEAARARIDQAAGGGVDAGVALRSPIPGELLYAVRPGSFVEKGDRLFQLAAPERRWLELHVPEKEALGLGPILGAWVAVDGDARVLSIGEHVRLVQGRTAVDPDTRTVSVIVEYPTQLGPSLVGARFPGGVFHGAARSVLAVPRSAVIDDGGLPVVYEQTGGEMFVRRPVRLGVSDGPWVEVLSGVAPGARVVDNGAYYVKLAATGGEEIGHGHAH